MPNPANERLLEAAWEVVRRLSRHPFIEPKFRPAPDEPVLRGVQDAMVELGVAPRPGYSPAESASQQFARSQIAREPLGWPTYPPMPNEPTKDYGPGMEAYRAMKRVFSDIYKDMQPEVIQSARGGARPRQSKWNNKPGMNLVAERAINESDLGDEVIARFLQKSEDLPHQPITKLRSDIERPLYNWASRVSETEPTPDKIGRAQRMVRNAGKIRRRFVGKDENDPEVVKARQWLESRGLVNRRPQLSLDQEIGEKGTTLGDITATPPPATSRDENALSRLNAYLEVTDPKKGLSEKQRETLALRYGIDRPGGKVSDVGTLSINEEARLLGQSTATVHGREKAAIEKIRKALKIKPKEQGPPAESEYLGPAGGPTKVGIDSQLQQMRDRGESALDPATIKRIGATYRRSPTGERLYQRDPELYRQARLRETEGRKYLGPAGPPDQIPIPDRPPRGEQIREIREKIGNLEQFQNQKGGYRLVQDPNGPIVVGEQRFRRVKIRYKHVKDPNTGKRKRQFYDEEK